MLIEQVRACYLDHHKEKTLRHAEEVAQTARGIAGAFGLQIDKVDLAAILHDIGVIMTPQEMFETAVSRGMPLDPAEEKYHFLLHQRMSRIIAAETFSIDDPEVLNAVECHTTLKKDAGAYDKAIFIADKISWDQEGKPPYYDLLREKAAESLDEACYWYIRYQFDHDLLLMPHRWIVEAYADLRNKLGKAR